MDAQSVFGQIAYLIDLEDAVVAGKVKLNQAINLTATGAVSQ